MSSDLIQHIRDADFDRVVLQANTPVLVDFWAPWCAPCKAIAPILDTLAQSYQGKVQVVKVNVDDNRDSPARFSIRGIPALLLFKDGALQETLIGGNTSKEKLSELFDKHI